MRKRRYLLPGRWLSVALLAACSIPLCAQTCLTAEDMDAAAQSGLLSAAKNYFDLAARGDRAGLKQNSIPSLAENFSAVESALQENQAMLAGATATPRPAYLLRVEGAAPMERAEFLCGVFGPQGQTAHSVVFMLNHLPPGSYGVEILDVSSSKGAYTASFVLQKEDSGWKLGGLYLKAAQAGGHDGNWFAEKARAFRTNGQSYNAWLYFLQARDLLVPVPFMSTLATDKLYDEAQTVKPAALPPMDLVADGKTYQVTALFPAVIENEIDLVVKYAAPDISNTARTYQSNIAVIKALVAKYPEFRHAFDGVVARAVDPAGSDYGSLLLMKDVPKN
ncbi:MAG: hypothetical protein JST79_14235 [Acidobacteria bacterium]|jgi:hypothetical protein|nr:hypothetical protein [Acidobacteriota bacterium]